MSRVLAAGVLSLAAVACGGSSEKTPPPPTCPAPVAPSGTLTGAGGGLGPFTPAEMAALVAGPTTCTLTGIGTLSVSGIFLGFTSFQGICPLLTQDGVCFVKASGTIVGVQIANAGLTSSVPGPGTYTVGTSGNTITMAGYTRSGASCAGTVTSNAVSGSVDIATVTSTQVTGSASLTFADGSTLAGTFTAAAPQVGVNVCQLANQIAAGCSGTPPCIP